ncbi:MAG: ATP-binding cassette domain-containing protein [Asticcacaulis sp.]|uniref:ATP-binding cassette domain-containing protein n=1 Tax=Asticcacaulis sp. TaxID=1872648 RepID=UPI003F7CA53B
MSPAILTEGLYCKQGGFTLGPLDLSVPRGSITALIGPNGAGKTTLLDLMMGLGRARSGRIELLGLTQPGDEVAIKTRVAYVNPDVSYAVWGTVGRALDFVRGFYPDWDETRCARLLTAFELTRAQKITALSFGGRIKLSLTMALAREAELLLLDEPTVGLDVNARRVLFHELLNVVKADNRTVLISSHQLSDLERLADHCAIISNGRLEVMAPMDRLLERYVQLDAVCAGRLPDLSGVRLIARNGDRVRLLLDRHLCDEASLSAQGVRVVAGVPLNLEDLFLALTSETQEKAA